MYSVYYTIIDNHRQATTSMTVSAAKGLLAHQQQKTAGNSMTKLDLADPPPPQGKTNSYR